MEPANNENNNVDLKSQIMEKIKCESVHPHSRLLFKLKEYSVRTIFVLFLVVAAVAVSITTFSLIYGSYAFYEITHKSFWLFLMDILPYIWLIIFSVMVLLAIYNVRQMNTGYRYALWKIIGGTILLSLLTGVIFHLLGFGFFLDQKFGHFISGYDSQESKEVRFWQNPNDGKLIVSFDGPLSEKIQIITVSDIKGDSWRTNITDLNTQDLELLNRGKKVRLVGQITKDDMSDFHACAVFPWIFEHEYTRSELQELREKMKNRFGKKPDEINSDEFIIKKSEICGKMPFMKSQPR